MTLYRITKLPPKLKKKWDKWFKEKMKDKKFREEQKILKKKIKPKREQKLNK